MKRLSKEIFYSISNVAKIVPYKLKTTAIIANTLDRSRSKAPIDSSCFTTKVIPSAIPIIPTIRLPIERILAKIEITFLKSSEINRINNINTADNDGKIQDNVINARAAIIILYLSEDITRSEFVHTDLPSSKIHLVHNPSVHEPDLSVFFPLKERICLMF